MTVRNLTKSNGPIILQEDRDLHGKLWHFRLEVPREFWEDIFDQIDHDNSPKSAIQAYERDSSFWSWLVIRLADTASSYAMPGASNRTLSLDLPEAYPMSVYDEFRASKPA